VLDLSDTVVDLGRSTLTVLRAIAVINRAVARWRGSRIDASG
jgi:hypothetical protein